MPRITRHNMSAKKRNLANIRMDRPPVFSADNPDICQLDNKFVRMLENPEKLAEINEILKKEPELAKTVEHIIKQVCFRMGVNALPPGMGVDDVVKNTMKKRFNV
ncbi:unnamed protein product [marine sediment metagenome]|uniref:Uncharacterized protein n=1 Tax=marine sediment metagenome TaxID=412755 RepID=X0T267_9ZZZZ